MKKFVKDRKAFSALIATLLVAGIVITFGVIVTSWASSNFSLYEDQASIQVSSKSNSAEERFTVEEAWFVDSDHNGSYEKAYVYIRNVGNIEIKIAAAYFNGTLQSATTPSLPLTVRIGQVASLEINLINPIQSGKVTSIILATERGNTEQYFWKTG